MRLTKKYTNDELACALAQEAGMMKRTLSGPNTAALLQIGNAIDAIKQTRYWQRETKYLFSLAINQVKAYRYGLLHPTGKCLPLFGVDNLDPEWKERYKKDLTDEEYLEFWEGIGGEMYADSEPYIKALRYKFERWFKAHGKTEDARNMAEVVVADYMVNLAGESFVKQSQHCQAHMPRLAYPISDLCGSLNIDPVAKAWHKAAERLFIGLPELDKRTLDDIILSVRQIIDLWTDPRELFEATDRTLDAFSDDVFRTKGYYKKLKRLYGEERQYVEEEVRQIQIEELKQKHKL